MSQEIEKNNHKAFTLIELLVVVAIIGILAAVGVVAYNGYTSSAKKAVVKQNFRTTVSYMQGEFAKCGIDTSARIFGDPGVPCNDIFKNKQWSCAAITLTHKYGLANPLDTDAKSYSGRSYNHPSGNCAVKMKGSQGVGAGDGEDDGEVTMVVCPRKPYCSDNSGKFKIMWWWDNKQMQDFAIIDPNF